MDVGTRSLCAAAVVGAAAAVVFAVSRRHASRSAGAGAAAPEPCSAANEVEELRARVRQLETERAAERAGRTKAEKRLHEVRMATEARRGTPVFAIGKAVTPFPDRFGTPRQGMLVPDAVGRIELDTTQIQGVSLDGLQQHSHVWISFLFHTNTNTARLSGMNAPKPGKDGRPPRRKVFPAKVAPPALGGRRVGVFSTRSPHRPNPVGLTLVRLERVDTRRGVLHVSGLDLVNGTPVIDIKPYMPPYDALPKASCPAWVRENWSKRTPVDFADEAEAKIEELRSCLTMYDNKTEAGLDRAKRAMRQALALDMRSSYRGRNTAKQDNTMYRWDFDRLTVCWTVIAGTFVVCDVEKARRGSGPQQLSPPRRKPKGHLSATAAGGQRRPSPAAAPSTAAPSTAAPSTAAPAAGAVAPTPAAAPSAGGNESAPANA